MKLSKLTLRSKLLTFVLLMLFSLLSIVVNFDNFNNFERSDNFRNLNILYKVLIVRRGIWQ